MNNMQAMQRLTVLHLEEQNFQQCFMLSIVIVAMYLTTATTYGLAVKAANRRRIETGICMALGAAKKIIAMGALLFITNFSSAAEEPLVLFSFEFEDQFKREYTENSWNKDLLIFIIGDRKGSAYINDWSIALNTYFMGSTYNEQYQQIWVASVGGTPRLMRGLVRRMFSDDKQLWSLLDWDNTFHQHYQLKDDATNILIFDKARRLIFKQDVREFSEDTFKQFNTQLEQLF